MLIHSQFIDGYGSFDSDKADAIYNGELALVGKVTLIFADDWGKRRITCWVIAKIVTPTSFELTVGPLKGRVFENPVKQAETDYDYFGWIGPFDEICVRGWKRISETGVQFVALEFFMRGDRVANASEQAEPFGIEF